jgi:hypothetical protein
MMVPLAERSTTGAGGCFLAAAAGIAPAAKRPLKATLVSGRTTEDKFFLAIALTNLA